MAVSDFWHRTLVYFGMADEPDDYDDEFDDGGDDRERRQADRGRERERYSSAQEDLERSYRERPNVRRLGSRRRDDDFDDIARWKTSCEGIDPNPRTDHAAIHATTSRKFEFGKNRKVSAGADERTFATPPAFTLSATATTASPAMIMIVWIKSVIVIAHMPPTKV